MSAFMGWIISVTCLLMFASGKGVSTFGTIPSTTRVIASSALGMFIDTPRLRFVETTVFC
jgi:hypothetical protein